jgi:hypothetical protein
MRKFISNGEFAEALGVSKATVARGRKNGKYPYTKFIKIGRKFLYPISLLDELEKDIENNSAKKIKNKPKNI